MHIWSYAHVYNLFRHHTTLNTCDGTLCSTHSCWINLLNMLHYQRAEKHGICMHVNVIQLFFVIRWKIIYPFTEWDNFSNGFKLLWILSCFTYWCNNSLYPHHQMLTPYPYCQLLPHYTPIIYPIPPLSFVTPLPSSVVSQPPVWWSMDINLHVALCAWDLHHSKGPLQEKRNNFLYVAMCHWIR